MNLVIDIGNSLQKIAVFCKDEMIHYEVFDKISKENIVSIISNFEINNSIISSVSEFDTEIVEFLKSELNHINFTQKTKLPILILYKTPETLGLDRIACAVGANSFFPNQNVLAIQVGTCLVCDFVNVENEYLGGSISPGMKMRFEALHKLTANLPLIAENENVELIGKATEISIRSGVMNGICYEIDGAINSYKEIYPNITVVLTGGNMQFFQKSIKNTIFAAQNLVLTGLNEIIKYNE